MTSLANLVTSNSSLAISVAVSMSHHLLQGDRRMATSRSAHAAALKAAKLEGAEVLEKELDELREQVSRAQETSSRQLQEMQRQQVCTAVPTSCCVSGAHDTDPHQQ